MGYQFLIDSPVSVLSLTERPTMLLLRLALLCLSCTVNAVRSKYDCQVTRLEKNGGYVRRNDGFGLWKFDPKATPGYPSTEPKSIWLMPDPHSGNWEATDDFTIAYR